MTVGILNVFSGTLGCTASKRVGKYVMSMRFFVASVNSGGITSSGCKN